MELDRAMAAQLFYNLEGKPAVTGDSTFTDVTSGHWAVDAITWAAQNDIVAGIGGNLYDPDSNVTREQFAVMLYKYARFKGLRPDGYWRSDPVPGRWLHQQLGGDRPELGPTATARSTAMRMAPSTPKGQHHRAQAASILAHLDQSFAKQVNLLHTKKWLPSGAI